MEKCIHGKLRRRWRSVSMENWTGPVKKKCVHFVFAYKQIDFESYIVPCDRALAPPALPLQMPILGPLLHYGNATYSIMAMHLIPLLQCNSAARDTLVFHKSKKNGWLWTTNRKTGFFISLSVQNPIAGNHFWPNGHHCYWCYGWPGLWAAEYAARMYIEGKNGWK